MLANSGGVALAGSLDPLQMAKLDQKKDANSIESLGQKADGLMQKLGPDYVKLVDGIDQMDDKSDEAKQFGAALGSLDKQCK